MTITSYATLRTAVESAIARSDVPDYVYLLAAQELNARLRLRQMESDTTLTASSEEVNLPADFLYARNLYLDADPRCAIDIVDEFSSTLLHRTSGRPAEAIVTGSTLTLNPVPDGSYDLNLRYVASLASFSADADTNDVLTTFPALYLYSALKHASVWAQDQELAGTYAAALEGEISRVQKADKSARYGGGPLRVRAAHTP